MASRCEQSFSLQHFFISPADIEQVLNNPSQQVIRALNTIFVETLDTLRIKKLDTTQSMTCFWDHRGWELSTEQCQEKVIEKLRDKEGIKAALLQPFIDSFMTIFKKSCKRKTQEGETQEEEPLETTPNPVTVKMLKVK